MCSAGWKVSNGTAYNVKSDMHCADNMPPFSRMDSNLALRDVLVVLLVHHRWVWRGLTCVARLSTLRVPPNRLAIGEAGRSYRQAAIKQRQEALQFAQTLACRLVLLCTTCN